MKEQRTMDDELYDVHYEPAYIEDSIKSDTCNCAIDYKVRRHKNIDTYRVFRHPRVCTQCESTKLLWHNHKYRIRYLQSSGRSSADIFSDNTRSTRMHAVSALIQCFSFGTVVSVMIQSSPTLCKVNQNIPTVFQSAAASCATLSPSPRETF